ARLEALPLSRTPFRTATSASAPPLPAAAGAASSASAAGSLGLSQGLLRLPAGHLLAGQARHGVGARGQRRRDALALRRALVLAELGLALEARHAQLEADDAAQHALPVALREALPALPVPGLVRVDELVEELLVGLRVADHPRPSVGVHRQVVPGRHALERVVVARRYVGVRPVEHGQDLLALDVAPLRVGLREVAAQEDLLALDLHRQRQVRGDGPALAHRHAHREAVRAHERQHGLGAFHLELGGDVHATRLYARGPPRARDPDAAAAVSRAAARADPTDASGRPMGAGTVSRPAFVTSGARA